MTPEEGIALWLFIATLSAGLILLHYLVSDITKLLRELFKKLRIKFTDYSQPDPPYPIKYIFYDHPTDAFIVIRKDGLRIMIGREWLKIKFLSHGMPTHKQWKHIYKKTLERINGEA